MIKLILLTGFLGAGKTTLMTSILDAYKNKKVGVIINEFGRINIDAVLVKREGMELAELSSGSIFCACLKEKFVDSLIEMSGRDIEYLFIEASGLADPSNMAQILGAIGHKLEKQYNYRGTISIVDSENFLKLYELLPALHNQIEYASAVIVNKADLVDTAVIEDIVDKLTVINSEAVIHITSYCRLDISKLVDTLSAPYKESKETTNTVESRPKTVVLVSTEALPWEKLDLFLHDVSASAYRIKGFAATDKGSVEISTVGENVNLLPWDEAVAKTEIVVISSVGIKIISAVARATEKYLRGKIRIQG